MFVTYFEQHFFAFVVSKKFWRCLQVEDPLPVGDGMELKKLGMEDNKIAFGRNAPTWTNTRDKKLPKDFVRKSVRIRKFKMLDKFVRKSNLWLSKKAQNIRLGNNVLQLSEKAQNSLLIMFYNCPKVVRKSVRIIIVKWLTLVRENNKKLKLFYKCSTKCWESE